MLSERSLERKIRLIDVTLRDGGYTNAHTINEHDLRSIYRAASTIPTDYCEVGYYKPAKNYDPSTPVLFSSPELLSTLCKVASKPLSLMVHTAKTPPSSYDNLVGRGINLGLVRLVFNNVNRSDIEKHAQKLNDLSVPFSINFTRVSEFSLVDVLKAAGMAVEVGAKYFYVADSNSSLYPVDVRRIISAVQDEVSIELGFHGHNALHMALVNSMTAINCGASIVDASMGGIGKNGGNLPMELLLLYLDNKKVVRVDSDVVEEYRELAFTTISEVGSALSVDEIIRSLNDLNMDVYREYKEGLRMQQAVT